MGLFNRLSTLAKADAHGVLDSLEDRSLLLKQCLREAECAMDRKSARREEINERVQQLQRALTLHTAKLTQHEADIELAMQQGNEDLSRFSIRRFLVERKRQEEIRDKLPPLREEREKLGEEIDIQSEEFVSLKERIRAHIAAADREPVENSETAERRIREEEVELELLRRREAFLAETAPEVDELGFCRRSDAEVASYSAEVVCV